MNLSGTSIIGFSRGQPGGNPFRAFNPTTGQELEPAFSSATSSDVDRAAELAAEAFAVYGQRPAKQRAEFLRAIAVGLEQAAHPIVERAHLETALPMPRLQSELARTCFQLRLYADIAAEGAWLDARIDHADPQRKPAPKPDLRSMVRPLGPVAVFGASNFPLAYAVAGGDTASALAAGNPVVVKAHPAHPGTSELVGLVTQRAVREAGLPEGVFSLLFDAGIEVGAAMVKHPLIKAVGFTGSRQGGRALMDLAAARAEPIPVYAEMGSGNPVFLLAGALRQRAEAIAAGLHASATLGVGQFCTNPGLVILENGEGAAAFWPKLTTLMQGTAPGVMLTSGICRNYRAGIEALSKAAGVRELVRVTPHEGSCSGGPALFATDADTFLENHSLMDEVFGPSSLVVECPDRLRLLAVARALEGQLTASVHGTDADLAANRELLAILETKAGRLIFNGFPTGVEVCHAMVHGGPYPATSDGRSTSVGGRALARFARPVCYQDFPDAALPDELKEANPLGLWRIVDGRLGRH
jgi:NADP-dependent aldehyde dehydrogenase